MEIISPKEVSAQINKSIRWVYSHADELGGAKIGGSWIFTREGFENAVQTKQKLASGGNSQRPEIPSIVQHKKGRSCLGKLETKGIEAERREAAKRHGLDDLL
jgi:hypothetical protein